VESQWSDGDVQLIEAHLDGVLAPEDAEALAGRLAREPALAALAQALRARRAVRAAVWAAGEPSAAEAHAVASRVILAAAGAERWRRAMLTARRATAVAALVMLAFAAGWMVRGRVHQGQFSVSPGRAADSRPWALAGGGRSSFPVALTDERGNVIAVQHFDDPTQARQFADDVGRWQSRPRRRAPGAEMVIPVSGEF
jgi:hypothetical protein